MSHLIKIYAVAKSAIKILLMPTPMPRGSAIAFPELHSGELKTGPSLL